VLGTLFLFQGAIRAKQASTLIMDFTGVPYIDSAGIVPWSAPMSLIIRKAGRLLWSESAIAFTLL